MNRWSTWRDELRQKLVDDMLKHYGVHAYPHPREGRVIVIGRSDFDRLHAAVLASPRLDAIGRGYYLGGFDLRHAPDWTVNPHHVAQARLAAALIVTLRLRQITSWLDRKIGGTAA